MLDHAARWARPEARLTLETVHRFTDPEYADLSLLMRTGERGGEVFDALVRRGEIVIHHSEVERLEAVNTALTTAVTTGETLIVADTRDQVSALNAAIRDLRLTTGQTTGSGSVATAAGARIGIPLRRRSPLQNPSDNAGGFWSIHRGGASRGVRQPRAGLRRPRRVR